jgi:hypothetical protein
MDVNKFYGKRFEKLSDAQDYVETHNEPFFDFAIIPPRTGYETDEEEIDETNLLRNDVPTDIPGELELMVDSDDDNIPLSKLQVTKNVPIKWRKRPVNMEMETTKFFQKAEFEKKEALEGKSPIEVFETLFDDEVVNLIIDQSLIYAKQHNNHSFQIDKAEMKVFIAILLFSGYHSMPREKMYWKTDEDTRIPIVANNMSRNRFEEVKRYIHFADNTKLDLNDKMAKVRPLQTLLCVKFCQFGYMHEKLSIDESMVRYFGSHPSKQFIRGKPCRFGFKNWMLTSSCGYVYQFDTYCGAKTLTQREDLPLGSRVVLDLLSKITYPTDHIVFFDNFFTSYDLLRILKEKGFRATGTVRENRIKKCPLKAHKVLQKEERGNFDYK